MRKVTTPHIIISMLLACGIVERVIWNAIRSTSGASGEAMHVAMAIGRGDGFADAYRLGQGATAHLMPISPGWAGMVYYLLGVNSPSAEFVLASWSIGLALGTYLILYDAFKILKVPQDARLMGFGLACILPTYFSQEAVDFRVWDGGLAVFTLTIVLHATIRLSAQERYLTHQVIVPTLTASLSFFVNPSVGVCSFACLALLCILRGSMRDYILIPIIAALSLSSMVVPWAIRNNMVLGSPVLLRSNAGLELAIANYAGAINPTNRGQEFMARLQAIHPAVGDDAYARMQTSGGEVAYARDLGARTTAWMKDHPTEVAQLAMLHVRQTLFPQEWQFAVFGTGKGLQLRTVLSQLVGLFGLIGLALGVRRQWRGWMYPAVLIATLVLVSAPFQPVKRYTYLLYPTLMFCATEAFAFAFRKIRKRAFGTAAD